MIEALIDGERRGAVLADLAIGRMRKKIPGLSMALEARFEEHHAMLCRLHLDRLDRLDGMLKELGAQIEAMMQPFRAARDLLITIPGIGPLSAAAVISEIGAYVRGYSPTYAILVINWRILATGKPYDDLGADYFSRLDPERETRRLISKLEALGHRVTLEEAA